MQISPTKTHLVGKTIFTIKSKYLNLSSIGKGSYGVVASCMDKESKKRIAIKKISSIHENIQDAKQVLREVRLMRYLSSHQNIVTIENLSYHGVRDELYIYMELMDSDLHKVIQSKQKLSDDHNRFFMYQILRALRFIHKQNIIHRDLKPGNILVNKDCYIRISDFGMSRMRPIIERNKKKQMDKMIMTQHIVTRWYRAPELMLHPDGLYTSAVDMWSAGCIFAELLARKPIFPGKNFVHQLSLIMDVLGSPYDDEIAHITSKQATKFLNKFRGKQKKSFSSIFPINEVNNPEAVDLIDKMLKFDPSKRLDANAALNHPYFMSLQTLEEFYPDPECNYEMDFDFEFEQTNVMKKLKKLIHEEVQHYEDNLNPNSNSTVAIDSGGQCRHVKSTSDQMSQKIYNEDKSSRIVDQKLQSTNSSSSSFDNKENLHPSRVSEAYSSKSMIKATKKDTKQRKSFSSFYGNPVQSQLKAGISRRLSRAKTSHVTREVLKPRKVTPDEKFNYRKKRGRTKTIPQTPKFSVMSWQR